MKKYKGLILLISLLFIYACAPRVKYIIENFFPPRTVAVLPIANETNDLDAPDMVRSMFIDGLSGRGYYAKPIGEIDSLLRKEGITEGGQLNAISTEELLKLLKVDAVFYGTLLEFSDITLGYYQNRVVMANFKLIDLKSGDLLWEDEKKVSHKSLALNSKEAWKAFKRQVAVKTVEKTLNVHLMKESQKMINRILSTLPNN